MTELHVIRMLLSKECVDAAVNKSLIVTCLFRWRTMKRSLC